MTVPLIQLTGVSRNYSIGNGHVVALDEVDLSINAGEFVAIVGNSGSGKSTLLNVIGCLARPTDGLYILNGIPVTGADDSTLARLRRQNFGFIFQQYHLLSDMSAAENVEMPAVYEGASSQTRRTRARRLLERLGLGQRVCHTPPQLSGGQQQRVSIARALMNGGAVLLADEPTGALDAESAREVMDVFTELNDQGHTVIMVTHDDAVAKNANRVIKMESGSITDDFLLPRGALPKDSVSVSQPRHYEPPLLADCAFEVAKESVDSNVHRLGEGIQFCRARSVMRMAVQSLLRHRLRTGLTIFGIAIGVSTLVSMVAISERAKERALEIVKDLGTNTIEFFPSRGLGDENASSIQTMMPSDVDALSGQEDVDSASAEIFTYALLRRGRIHARSRLTGTSPAFFRVQGLHFVMGNGFDTRAVNELAPVVVIDLMTREKLFAPTEDPIGQSIFVGDIPCIVIGVIEKEKGPSTDSQSLSVWLPFSTMSSRIVRQRYLNAVKVRIRDGYSTESSERRLTDFLAERHRRKDFITFNANSFAEATDKVGRTMKTLLAIVAVAMLTIGGVGEMNMMLASVGERTREIGIRIAVGARKSDILCQFLIESVILCVTGGTIGLITSFFLSLAVSFTASEWKMVHSPTTILVALASSTVVGCVFGLLPARRASQLDPVDALAQE